MAEVLVTGTTGLLGSSVVSLLAANHDVTAIARHGSADGPGIRWILHDLARPALPDDLPNRIDAVIHLAQSRRFREFPQGAPDTFAVNVAVTARLLDWAVAAGASRFVLASTGGVYDAGPQPHHEDEPTGLAGVPSFYAASKLAAEVLARSYGAEMAVCILRPFFIYGRGQDAGMLLPRLARRVRSHEPIFLDGRDGMRFNPIHVSDAARAVAAALSLDESTLVNVAGPEVLSLRQAVTVMANHLGEEPNIDARIHVAPTDVIADTARMQSVLVRPTTILADAMEELGA